MEKVEDLGKSEGILKNDQIWSSLIQFGQIWSNLIQTKWPYLLSRGSRLIEKEFVKCGKSGKFGQKVSSWKIASSELAHPGGRELKTIWFIYIFENPFTYIKFQILIAIGCRQSQLIPKRNSVAIYFCQHEKGYFSTNKLSLGCLNKYFWNSGNGSS